MRTSFSALEIFESCPKRYEYQVIEKIKRPKSKEQVFGTTIHATLKYLFNQAPLFPTLSEIIEYFSVSWQESASKIANWTHEKEKGILLQEGQRILNDFYQQNIPNFAGKIIALETRFETAIPVPGQEMPHVLSGIIDRIDKIGEQEFEIIDYKTNRRLPAQNLIEKNLQLSIYALGFLEKWPSLAKLENIKLSLYFLKHSEKLSAHRQESDFEEIQRRVLKNISEIEKGYFPPIPSPLCKSCSYRQICPMWSHLYKRHLPEEAEVKKMVDEYFVIKEKADGETEKLAEIKKEINYYFEKKGLERVFGETGFISRTKSIRQDYDLEKAREILEKNKLSDFWQKIIGPDKKKWDIFLKSASPMILKLLESAKTKEKKSSITRAVKKSPKRLELDLD